MRIIGAMLASALGGCLTISAALAGDWPGFLGPQRDAVSTETGLLDKWPDAGPPVLWKLDVGRGFGGAAVHGTEVFILDRKEEAADVLRVFDLMKGTELWSFEYSAPGRSDHAGSRSTPTVDSEHVYTCGGFGNVYCIDRGSHKPIWSLNLQEKYKSGKLGWGFAQSPLLVGDHVIVSPVEPTTPGLIALDKNTGKVVWESENFGGDFYTSPTLRTVAGVTGIFQVTNDQVSFVDPATGKMLWKFNGWKCKWPIPAPVVMPDGNHAFITGGYGAGSVMLEVTKAGAKFDVKPTFKLPEGCQIHVPVLVDGHLYGNFNTNETLKGPTNMVNGGLMCIDPAAGKVAWRTGAKPNFDRGAVMLAEGRLLAMDGKEGVLYLIKPDPAGYKELAHAKIFDRGAGNEIWAPMALSSGLLIIRDQTHMKCLDLRGERRADAR